MQKTIYELDLSPDGKSYYSLYKLVGGERELIHNLSTLYPKALVKAVTLAQGNEVINRIPEDRRVMIGKPVGGGTKKAMSGSGSTMPFGKYEGLSVRKILQREPSYLRWLWHEVAVVKEGQTGEALLGTWNECLLETFAYVLYYCPEFADNVTPGKLFTAFHGDTGRNNSPTEEQLKRAAEWSKTLQDMEKRATARRETDEYKQEKAEHEVATAKFLASPAHKQFMAKQERYVKLQKAKEAAIELEKTKAAAKRRRKWSNGKA